MKKRLITMMIVLVAMAGVNASAAHKHEHKKVVTEQAKEPAAPAQDAEQATEQENENGDATTITKDQVSISEKGIIVKDIDGKQLEVKFGELGRIVKEHLDDTVLNAAGITVVSEDDENASQGEEQDAGIDWKEHQYRMVEEYTRLARDISTGFFVAIVWIVGLALLFYYLHRRRKYKTVDRAIMNKYPLPDEFFSKRSTRAPQQPTTVYINQVVPPTIDPNAPQGTHPVPPAYAHQSGNPLNNITDWAPYKGGFITTIVGLCLMLFFLIVGANAVAALMLIIVFIGLWKLFTTYQGQQSIKNYWQQQQWTQQATQQDNVPPFAQQSAQSAVPPMPQTPPDLRQEM